MKFNIAYPKTGAQKCLEIDDDKRCSIFYDKRMGQEVSVDTLGEEFKGYVLKITGGNDKDGFPMKQGVIIKGRARILMKEGTSTFRTRRSGHQKRKSCRGCIVGDDIRVLSLVVVKKGDKDIEGLTNRTLPQRLGPKRVTRLKKLFGLKKEDPVSLVRKNMIRRTWEVKGHKRQKAAKIQRIVTEARLRRKRIYKKDKVESWKKTRESIKKYSELLNKIRKAKENKHAHQEAPKEVATKQVASKDTKVVQKPAAGKQDPKKVTATTTKVDPKKATTTQAPKQVTKPVEVKKQTKK